MYCTVLKDYCTVSYCAALHYAVLLQAHFTVLCIVLYDTILHVLYRALLDRTTPYGAVTHSNALQCMAVLYEAALYVVNYNLVYDT
jgi:hypothetical protein